jgi:hypothetical protein
MLKYWNSPVSCRQKRQSSSLHTLKCSDALLMWVTVPHQTNVVFMRELMLLLLPKCCNTNAPHSFWYTVLCTDQMTYFSVGVQLYSENLSQFSLLEKQDIYGAGGNWVSLQTLNYLNYRLQATHFYVQGGSITSHSRFLTDTQTQSREKTIRFWHSCSPRVSIHKYNWLFRLKKIWRTDK